MADMKKWAKWYRKNLNWSVIPVGKNKKPLIKWGEYNTTLPTLDQIEEWWNEHPEANIAVITGAISGITVIDIDSYKDIGVLRKVKEIDPSMPWEDTLVQQTANGGYHWIFKYTDGLVTKEYDKYVDIKNDGGYILVFPSVLNNNGDNKYLWIKRPWKDKKVVEPTVFPKTYLNVWSNGSNGENNEHRIHNISFEEGNRDNTLFTIANALVRGGMDEENIYTVVRHIADSCKPPFSEADRKVQSAISRHSEKIESLEDEIKFWIEGVEGVFTTSQLDRDLKIISKDARRKRNEILHQLKKNKIIEGWGQAGRYRKLELEIEPINFIDAELSETYADMQFPLGEHELFHPIEKNIIIIAGVPDVGKTAYLMEFVRLNQDMFPIDYYSSEMGPHEYRLRLERFPTMKLSDWKFNAYEREGNFHDVINPNRVSIIDYLELTDNFYKVGAYINRIFRKLNNGIVLIALQKNPGNTNPLGGQRAREKARMVLNLDFLEDGERRATFTKCKQWRTPERPEGMYKDFFIVDGCQFADVTPTWIREQKGEE